MGLFDKLFEKKICAFCGSEIKLLGNRKLEDGNMCKACAEKLSPWFSDRRNSTVAEIQAQLEYREANKEKVERFQVTRTLGEGKKLLLDETAQTFLVTGSRQWRETNPDVFQFDQVTGCRLDIDESTNEIKYTDAEGKKVSYTPARYEYYYDFDIIIHVNNPFFDEVRFRLNSNTVEGVHDPVPAGRPGARPGGQLGAKLPVSRPMPGFQQSINHRNTAEYREYEAMGKEIVRLLTQIREDVREGVEAENAPKVAITCPWCGATTVADASGCCEYCGGALNQ